MDRDTKTDLADRLKKIAAHFEIQEQELAQRLGISKQAMSNYTQAKNEPKPSLLINLVKVFGVNPAWILMGEGVMLGEKPSSIPAEEISADLTPTQRDMLTYKRLQTELGTTKERIADGLDAIITGKCVSESKKKYGAAEDRGLQADATNKVQEESAEFGKGI